METIVKLYKGKEFITFDDRWHSFKDKNGNKLISVTGITGVVDKSAPLMFWAVRLSKEYLQKKIVSGEVISLEHIEEASKQHTIRKQEAADMGTQIHEWVSQWIKGQKPEMPKDEKIVNGITAFLKFQKENNVKWRDSERIVYSKKNKYVGILDATGMMVRKIAMFDFKSCNGIHDEMMFQVAGYQIAWEEEEQKKIDRSLIIRFGKEDGQFEAVEIDKEEMEKNKKAFLACLSVKRRLDEMKKGKKQYCA
jgi:hypothetical protein